MLEADDSCFEQKSDHSLSSQIKKGSNNSK
jgi:hypothetical protein